MSETTNAWSTSHYNVMRTDPENNKVLCGKTKDDDDDDYYHNESRMMITWF